MERICSWCNKLPVNNSLTVVYYSVRYKNIPLRAMGNKIQALSIKDSIKELQ